MQHAFLQDDCARALCDAVPHPIFVVDEEMRFLDANRAGVGLLEGERALELRPRGGEALQCVNAQKTLEGCGGSESCKDCVIRKGVMAAFQGQRLVQQKVRMEKVIQHVAHPVDLLITTSPLKIGVRQLVMLMIEDISELVSLRSLLPICAKCKKIRDDHQYWHELESYLAKHLLLDFTHGLCPDCAQEILDQANESGPPDLPWPPRPTSLD